MPWLPLYADENDLREIIDYLNNDPDVAFIQRCDKTLSASPLSLFSQGRSEKGQWKAYEKYSEPLSSRICLWHVPSGPLPLLTKDREITKTVKDPWKGWIEERTGADQSEPYFGAGHVGIIWLNVRTYTEDKRIGLSSFEWIGNYYSAIGNIALPSTEKWWKQLRTMITRKSEKIGREDTMKPEIFCLPSAMDKIKSGFSRDGNP